MSFTDRDLAEGRVPGLEPVSTDLDDTQPAAPLGAWQPPDESPTSCHPSSNRAQEAGSQADAGSADSSVNGRHEATGEGLSSLYSLSSTIDSWPSPPTETAFYGLPGEIVRTIEPHSEADPVALLIQLLVVAGNIIGKGPHFTVEADDHHPNLYAVLVGETSKGRKGSSYGHIERLAKAADQTWADRVESGLTSGEGLIWRVRDPSEDDARDAGGDEGEKDKRLLVLESEFANVLHALERQGNRLSPIIRDAWDGRPLRTLTRTTSAKATGAHVSIIGHITADELRRYLDRTEVANGFGNRFLWFSVRRSRSLPDGGRMHTVDVSDLIGRLREAVRFASTVKRVERDEEAKDLWHAVYDGLSEGLPGLVGALTGRAEAQVMRLAHLHALLDLSPKIRLPHLQAALELWDYSLRSVQHIFGASLGDPIADTILGALRQAAPEPLSRSDIRTVVGGKTSAPQIAGALALLARYRLAHTRRGEESGGRPPELWYLGVEEREEREESPS